MKNNSSYFQNRECEFFPCHKTDDDFFNCLFCYCPLYSMGSNCGGNFTFTPDGVKDCSECLIPHGRNGYSYVLDGCRKMPKEYIAGFINETEKKDI